MKYYRAKHDCYDYFNKFGVVKDELLTEKERNTKCRYIMDHHFDIVNISCRNTFMSFGARFEIK